METIELIPAIDIIDGQCVRLSQGDYAAKIVYDTDPVRVARRFESQGITRLHLVDLDGAKAGAIRNLRVLEQIVEQTSLRVDFGGGVKTETDVEAVLKAGAAYVTVGSMAVRQPNLVRKWITTYGEDKFLIGCDVRDGRLALNGWQETSEDMVWDCIGNYLEAGFNHFFCTDISKDGMLQGPGIDLYRQLLQRFPDLYLIASGGIASNRDLSELASIGCKAAIIGKAIYENKLTVLKP